MFLDCNSLTNIEEFALINVHEGVIALINVAIYHSHAAIIKIATETSVEHENIEIYNHIEL